MDTSEGFRWTTTSEDSIRSLQHKLASVTKKCKTWGANSRKHLNLFPKRKEKRKALEHVIINKSSLW